MGLHRWIVGLAAAALAASHAGPAPAATITVPAKAKVVKPLALKSVQDLELGNIFLGTGTWSGAVVRLTRLGVFTCPANVTCSGLKRVAQYNVSGSNNETVRVFAPNVILTNQSDPTKTLTLVVDSPGTVALANSSPRGVDFPLGGSITVSSTTADGNYVGTFNVSVDYQ